MSGQLTKLWSALLVAVFMLATFQAPAAVAITAEEAFKAMHWPMPLPDMVGWSMERTMSDSIFSCLENISGIAPDGHDVMNDTTAAPVPFSWWKVATMTPPAGTMVSMDQKITMTVIRDPNAPGS